MMKRFYELRSGVASTIARTENCPTMIDNDCQTWIPEVVKLLHELELLTVRVSSATQVTSSIVIPSVQFLYSSWEKLQLKTVVGIQLRTDLIAEAKVRLDKLEEEPALLMATFLDPRFKNKYFRSVAANVKAFELVTKELAKMLKPGQILKRTEDNDEMRGRLRKRRLNSRIITEQYVLLMNT